MIISYAYTECFYGRGVFTENSAGFSHGMMGSGWGVCRENKTHIPPSSGQASSVFERERERRLPLPVKDNEVDFIPFNIHSNPAHGLCQCEYISPPLERRLQPPPPNTPLPTRPRNRTKADASGCNFEAPVRRPPRLTSLFFLIDPGSSRDWDNIFVKLFSFLGESHFHISPLHALFITSLQLPCKRRLNCHPSLLLNSLVNIKPYLLLINPQLKKTFFNL